MIVGNGMVGHKLVETMVERDGLSSWEIVVFCEEPPLPSRGCGLFASRSWRFCRRTVDASGDLAGAGAVERVLGGAGAVACEVEEVAGSGSGDGPGSVRLPGWVDGLVRGDGTESWAPTTRCSRCTRCRRRPTSASPYRAQ